MLLRLTSILLSMNFALNYIMAGLLNQTPMWITESERLIVVPIERSQIQLAYIKTIYIGLYYTKMAKKAK